MNILVLNYEFPPIGGGASPVSFDISKGYVKHGHNVHVVTMKYGDLPEDEIIEGISIHRVKCIRKEKYVCHPWEQLTYIVSAVAYLKKYVRNRKVDCIHTHFIIPTGVISWYLNRKFGIPYLITAHGSDVPGYNDKRFGVMHVLLRRPWKKILSSADQIVAPSKFLRDLILSGWGEKNTEEINDKITLIPNGIDTSIYYSKEKKKIILLMARIQETKGMQDILECLDRDILGEWSVVIAGDGPYRSELERIVEKNDIKDKVTFLGWVKPKSEEQLNLLAESAIFMSASRFENCPMTLMEAYCSGCKLIVSDIRGHREIAGDRATYFDLGNKDEIRNRITEAIREYDADDEQVIDKSNYDWDNKIIQYEGRLSDIIVK